jgi:hypothetical protein
VDHDHGLEPAAWLLLAIASVAALALGFSL